MSSAQNISVLLPVYNAGVPLTQAIESILQQTHRNLELLAIDDCSTDGSAAIIRRFADADSRVRGIFHRQNQGLSATLNEGLALATGELVARMDQDDEALPERLAVQSAFLAAHPMVVATGSWVFNMGRTTNLDRLVRLPYSHAEICARLPQANCLYHPTVMLRRRPILALGGYRAPFKNAEDYDLWLRASIQHRLANIPRPLLRYRLSTGGMTISRKWEQLRYVFIAQECHRDRNADWGTAEARALARLAGVDRQDYFERVGTECCRRLHQLGFAADALDLARGMQSEMRPTPWQRLCADLGHPVDIAPA